MKTRSANGNDTKHNADNSDKPHNEQPALKREALENADTDTDDDDQGEEMDWEEDDEGEAPFPKLRFVEAWVAGWVSRKELKEKLERWANGLHRVRGHREVLFVFPRGPHSHVVGFTAAVLEPHLMQKSWQEVFAGDGPVRNVVVASEITISDPLSPDKLPQEVLKVLAAAAITSVPTSAMRMQPFIVDQGDVVLLTSERAETKCILQGVVGGRGI
jgi:hypothetical protein